MAEHATGLNEYLLYLERPQTKALKHAKLFWDIVLVLSCWTIGILYFVFVDPTKMKVTAAGTFFAAGLLPPLLSMPVQLAEWSVRLCEATGVGCVKVFCTCFCFRDAQRCIGFVFNIVYIVIAMVLFYQLDEEDLVDALTEVLMEVALIYSVTTLLGIPTIDTDATRSFLRRCEALQLERSGCVDAPFAEATDFALCFAYHDDMMYMYPNSVTDESLHAWEARLQKEAVNNQDLDQASTRETESLIKSEWEVEAASGLNSCGPGWNSVWFLAAISCCPRGLLAQHLIDGLLGCLTGTTEFTDRFICQSAVTTLAHLYFQSESQSISQRLIDLYAVHEISDVREYCVLGVKAIGNPVHVAWMDDMTNLESLKSTKASENYFEQRLIGTRPLQCDTLIDACEYFRASNSNQNAAFMGLLSACCLLLSDHGSIVFMVRDYIEIVLGRPDESGNHSGRAQGMLHDPLEWHLAKQVALEGLVRAIRISKKSEDFGTDYQRYVWIGCDAVFRANVFKEVRMRAKQALQEAEFPYLDVYSLFEQEATDVYKEEGWEAAESLLETKLRHNRFFKQLCKKLSKRPFEEISARFEASERRKTACRPNWPADDPNLLLYVYVATQGKLLPERFLQARLLSQDRFERYVGLFCIGALSKYKSIRKLRAAMVPRMARSEIISDVRNLAVYVLEDWEQGGKCSRFRKFWVPDESEQRDRAQILVDKELARLRHRIAQEGRQTGTPERLY